MKRCGIAAAALLFCVDAARLGEQDSQAAVVSPDEADIAMIKERPPSLGYAQDSLAEAEKPKDEKKKKKEEKKDDDEDEDSLAEAEKPKDEKKKKKEEKKDDEEDEDSLAEAEKPKKKKEKKKE